MAADAVLSASYPHCFMGITKEGRAAICKTKGNPCCHIILRGGKEGPNYFPQDIVKAVQIARNAGIREAIMIDCSHGNSGKDHTQQPAILRNIMDQAKRNEKIIGIMMESNLCAGNQCLKKEQPLQSSSTAMVADTPNAKEPLDLLPELLNKYQGNLDRVVEKIIKRMEASSSDEDQA